MSVRISGLLLGATLALTVTAALAAEYTSANRGMEGCRSYLSRSGNRSGPDPVGEGYCQGIVEGIMSTGGSLRLSPGAAAAAPVLCLNPPVEATAGQGIRVVAAYIDARPERLHEPFTVLVREALQTAWPCK
jgi:hypothetical protein